MFRTKKSLYVGIGVAVFLYALLTGGVIVSCSTDFDGQSDITLVPGLKSDVWLSPQSSSFFVPMLFGIRRYSGPYGLRLQIWDESRQYVSIDIAEILLEYADGEVVRKSERWVRDIQPYTHFGSLSGKVIQTEMHALGDSIENLVLKHGTVKITLKGHLRKKDGSMVPFVGSETFEAESRIRVYTLWQELAGA